MEANDDMIVVIIEDKDDVKLEDVSAEVNDTKKLFEEHSEVIVKLENEEDLECEYLEDAEFLEELENIKTESGDENTDIKAPKKFKKSRYDDSTEDNDSEIETSEDEKNNSRFYPNVVLRRKPLKPSQYKSFVAELRKEYPELREDRELLVNTLAAIMRDVKTPKPPDNHYTQDGIRFRCNFCSASLRTRPAATRHYQEKHGQFYLVCFACGFDFRGTLYLYRHEKRCRAPDAQIVLRARARSIGSKARSRPYIQYTAPLKGQKAEPAKRLPCSQCSATFSTKLSLTAHENMHLGRRPYRCDICPNAYTSPQTLYRHTQSHVSTFICDHCAKSFKTRSTLIGHMNVHRPKKSFACEVCNRPFAHKAAMVRHVDKIHKNLPPPCACSVCDGRFMRMESLKKHMRTAHGLTLITRNMFQKALPKMSDTELKNMLNCQDV